MMRGACDTCGLELRERRAEGGPGPMASSEDSDPERFRLAASCGGREGPIADILQAKKQHVFWDTSRRSRGDRPVVGRAIMWERSVYQ